MVKELTQKEKEEILKEARERFELSYNCDLDNRRNALDDLKFINGDQWDKADIQEREANKRPYYTVNRLPGFTDVVIGEQRRNVITIKVKPFDDKADVIISNILEGIIRNIENNSDANVAYMNTFEQALNCGRGFFRIITEYCDDESFDQDIKIIPIQNQFSVFWDVTAKDKVYLSDSKYMFVSDIMTREDFEHAYPDKKNSSFEEAKNSGKLGYENWIYEKTVRVVEYWRKVAKEEKTLYLLKNGEKTYNKPKDENRIKKTRKIKIEQIECYKLNFDDILEGPLEWAGKYIPIIPVWGRELNIENKRFLRGIVRFAKDPQKIYNYMRTTAIEIIKQSPKAPYLLTEAQISGHEKIWNKINKKWLPYLLFNIDPKSPNLSPKRERPIDIPTGITHREILTIDEMKATTGIYDPSLGARSNETSGIAIAQRQQQSEIVTYPYVDNLNRAVKYAGKQLVDLIPKIYDVEKIIRIMGDDGNSIFKPINYRKDPETGEPLPREKYRDEKKNILIINGILNDISIGKYDTIVSAGPGFSTIREEAARNMIALMEKVPSVAPYILDYVVQNFDWKDVEKIVRRIRKTLPPGMVEEEESSEENIPENRISEEELMGAQQQIDPMAEIRLSQEQAKLDGMLKNNEKKELEKEKISEEILKIQEERFKSIKEIE